jgi:hypothetical protein
MCVQFLCACGCLIIPLILPITVLKHFMYIFYLIFCHTSSHTLQTSYRIFYFMTGHQIPHNFTPHHTYHTPYTVQQRGALIPTVVQHSTVLLAQNQSSAAQHCTDCKITAQHSTTLYCTALYCTACIMQRTHSIFFWKTLTFNTYLVTSLGKEEKLLGNISSSSSAVRLDLFYTFEI